MEIQNSTSFDSSGGLIYIEVNYGYLIGTLAFITILGVPMNGVVIFVFGRLYNRSPCTFNIIMMSNSLGDLLLIAIAGPTRVVAYLRGIAELGDLECKLYGCWVHLTSVASLGHLVLLAVERYQVIKHDRREDNRPVWKQSLIPMTAWLYATFWTILPIFGWSEYAPESQHVGCAPKWRSPRLIDTSYNITIMFSEFFIPLLVIIMLYFKIFRMIKEHGQRSQNTKAKDMKVERSVMMLTVFMVTTFVFSWLPYTICCLWSIFTTETLLSASLGAVPSVFAKSSVLWNPILYGLKHQKFRREIRRLYRRARGRNTASIDRETTMVPKSTENRVNAISTNIKVA